MKKTYLTILFISLTLCAGCLVLLEYYHSGYRTSTDKLLVVCTTSMLTDAVRTIGGPYVQVTGLMGPGVDPHIYRARERDAHALAHADLIMYHGLHLEGKMVTMLESMNNYTTTVAVADAIDSEKLLRMPGSGIVYDPHIWFDVRLWIHVVHTICSALTTADSTHANHYRRNAATYIRELNALDVYIHKEVARIPVAQRMLVTAHDAFGYLGRAYGLTVVALQGINTDAQASTHDIQQLANFIVHHRIPAIFVESSIPHRTLQAVQDAVHVRGWHITIDPELYSDALGTPGTPEETYVGMIKHNVDAIVRGLVGSASF